MTDVSPLPPIITYDVVPGREGLWTATIETRAGRITATAHSLHETREALEIRAREAIRGRHDPQDP